MKNSIFILFLITSLFLSCSKSEDDNNVNPTNPSSDYANYDFYISEGSKGGNNGGISKNFNPLSGYERITAFYDDNPLGFKIYGSSIYTYGSKQDRTLPENSPGYYPGTNYSGFLSKNNNILYSNLGGGSSTIYDMMEVGTNVFFYTSLKYFNAGVGVEQSFNWVSVNSL